MHSPQLQRLMVHARVEELRRAADRAALASRPPLPVRRVPVDEWVTLRFAFPDDAPALARLVELDGSSRLAAPVLVAEAGGALRAALSLSDGAVISDPFHPTGALIELLRARARQLAAADHGFGPGRRAGLRSRLRLAAWR